VSASHGWGIFRERTHSPGRESDDAEILRLTGKHLEARGYQIMLRGADELGGPDEVTPGFVFLMCETHEALRRLSAWEARGVPHVNSVAAVLNTYRDRMIGQFDDAGVPFVPSRLVVTSEPATAPSLPVWVKRADVHNTQDGDVVQAATPAAVDGALAALAERGIARAVLQPHIEGDLVKFYGIGPARRRREPAWFRWFHHADQRLAGHPVDTEALARLAARAAGAIGLEVYGGDAIVGAGGALTLLDLNAWPSFACYRDEAAEVIAAHVALRVGRGR
jgi:glutathione synthase/RimK-type ligase-like ATP-grasp enzyme